ncbi:hypothetical protein NM688_g4580 [Phlebia brevispora]|uniref:Uncharacterized protein n=1 Tax=Phlebia brevispora TaxID=194682 RepID=A0ACC1T2Q2_9APHY|nr:hypothetical protein NM688_g4580 [Phlebia brevispora]
MESSLNEDNNAMASASTSQMNGDTSTEYAPDIAAAHEAVIKALSSTVNGCMKEMGYFPGMLQLLQDTQHENAVLRDQNVKLHSDNVNLSRIINTQKEQIAALSTRTPIERDIEIETLRRQLRQLIGERDGTARAYQHLQMAYNQCRRELAQLTAFTQNHMTGRIEILRPGPSPPAPGMNPAQPPLVFEEAPLRYIFSIQPQPPFVPSHRPHPGGPYPPAPSPASMVPHDMQGLPTPMPISQPMTSHVRYRSSPTIDSSLSRMNIASNRASPVTPQHTPPASVSRPAGPLPGSHNGSKRPGSSSRDSVPHANGSTSHIIDLTTDEAPAEDTPRKKRRLEEDDIAEPKVAQDAVEEKLAQPQTESPADDEEAGSEDNEEATDGLDPDGRRSEAACLAIAFESDAEGKMWCTMCKLRFNKNLTSNAPTAFVGASTSDLVQHCEKEHPAGWNTLRGKPFQS